MFTGIVEDLAQVAHNEGGVLRILTSLDGFHDGDSVCVNGACLTVARRRKGEGARKELEFEMSGETLSRTCLGLLRPGDHVNIERSMTLQKLVGGHLVTGHVDAAVLILKRTPLKDGCVQLRFELPGTLRPFVALKGSVTLDGISLTVTRTGRFWLESVLVPHTLKHTTLGAKGERALVNLEVDLVARYLSKLLEER